MPRSWMTDMIYRQIQPSYCLNSANVDPLTCMSGNIIQTFLHYDVIKWKHFPRYWLFVRGIHRSPVNFPHKFQWRGASMFSLICSWLNGWVNNREAGDLRRHRAHYDVVVMNSCFSHKVTKANITPVLFSHASRPLTQQLTPMTDCGIDLLIDWFTDWWTQWLAHSFTEVMVYTKNPINNCI